MNAARKLTLIFMLFAVSVPAAQAGSVAPTDPTEAALMRAFTSAEGNVETNQAPETGTLNWVRATGTSVIDNDDTSKTPRQRAVSFLRSNGALIGMSDAERANPERVLRFVRIDTDVTGKKHVRFDQAYKGVPVFGAQILVHMTDKGITAINGNFIPGIAMSTSPRTSSDTAGRSALALARKDAPGVELSVGSATPMIYRTGLIEGESGKSVLTWSVIVEGVGVREKIFMDAITGVMVRRVPLMEMARDRVAYSPQYVREDPDLFALRREGDPPTNIPPVDNLYDFTGQVWDLFNNSFGRDSFDGRGKTMRTVYLINQVCPNAYWNSSTTNYCPGFDTDDVVAHEWGHAYTEYTHGLIYSCQSGALNESYSDIWGEVIDLLNGRDGPGGTNNDKPYPDGNRWLVGEDLGQSYAETAYGKTGGATPVILRDMWDPEAAGYPGKVSGSFYRCGTDDQGGVHSNSAVPNHAFTMLVDGKEYNNIKIRGIGMTKAAHIYFQAMTAYQTPSSKFVDHHQAITTSCADLLGVNLKELFTGVPSGKVINEDDCEQVAKASRSVELARPPTQCKFQPLLKPGAPPVCSGAGTIFSEDWEKGLNGWTKETHGSNLEWSKTQWEITSKVPKGRASHAAFADNPDAGSCEAGNDNSGAFNMDSPEFSIPESADRLKIRFDHWVSTESGFDGGNLMVSVNGGGYAALPASAYIFNPPNLNLAANGGDLTGGNDGNPKGGQAIWSGADGGDTLGSWGTSVADLSSVVKAGDKVRLRFDFGMDCASGRFGWYVDNIMVYECPELPVPEMKPLGFSGTVSKPVTISWNRPSGAVGPDTVQESSICSPLVVDDAESGLDQWDVTTDGLGAIAWQTTDRKYGEAGHSFWASAVDGGANASSSMKLKRSLKIPGEASLVFNDWFYNEGDDSVRVEVSIDGGKKWAAEYLESRSDLAPFALAGFATEDMTARRVDLSRYAGKTIDLRFTFLTGPDNRAGSTPFGWYVDDIFVTARNWRDVATVTGTSYKITSHVAGEGCFRVATTYKVNGVMAKSGFSAPSEGAKFAKFSTKVLGARRTKPADDTLPSTGLDAGLLPGLLSLVGAGGMTYALRRRRSI